MTIEEKKVYLSQYCHMEREITRLERQVALWRSRAEGLGRRGSSPGGSGKGRALENAASQMTELTRQLEERMGQCAALLTVLQSGIAGVQDARLRELLTLCYVEDCTLYQIAKAWDRDYRWVRRKHNQALEQVELKNF